MLKISITACDRLGRVVKLEGRLLADWVGELRAACQAAQRGAVPLRLDLSGLQFADPAGTRALREQVQRGAVITTVSPLVGELLKED
jgi:anti-anti-sigma regulatory factor